MLPHPLMLLHPQMLHHPLMLHHSLMLHHHLTHRYFTIDNFDELFEGMVVTQGNDACVELVS
jgi:hypothetical protein